ncbi:ribonuclease P protein component [Candidatus Nomurabacteria bacterium]|nr:ribonuclease P protein component [Candidatus Nomurabacteria bacterium]
MFKKTNRLTKVEFDEFYKTGLKKHFPHLTIITKPLQKTKTSVVVGKKVAKSAVRRNTLRRRVYATLKRVDTDNKSLGGIIIILKPSYNSLTRKAAEEFLKQSIAQVLKGA